MPEHGADIESEFRLLLACATPTQAARETEKVVELGRARLDWTRFQQLVLRHRVAPVVFETLSNIDDLPVPQQTRDALRRMVEVNTLNALRQAGELVRLVREFGAAGVRVLPLKGPVVAMQAYGDLRLRHAGDLDLLVDPEALRDADRLLKTAGYIRTVPDYELSSGQQAAYTKIRKDFSYARGESSSHVELHWRWSQNAHLVPLDLDDVWARRDPVRLGSESVAAMPAPELLLYLCAHGAHTGWFRLKWLCDVAELTRELSGPELAQIIARANDLGVERMLFQALLLAHRMLASALPDVLPTGAREDKRLRSLVRMGEFALRSEARYWSTDDTPVSFMPAQARYRLQLRAGLRYKWHNLYFHSLWTDGCRRLRLPERLFPFYFVLAPIAWAASLLRGPRDTDTETTERKAN